jgi:hypothetical protein
MKKNIDNSGQDYVATFYQDGLKTGDPVKRKGGGKVVNKKEGKKIAYEDESIGGRRGAVGKTDLKGTHAQKEKKRRRMSDAGVYGKLS